MHWFIADETNKNPALGQFFIVGGLVVTDEQIAQVHNAVEEIRWKCGYQDGDSLKFQLAARPAQVTPEQATRAKKLVISALGELGIRMLTYVLLHDIGVGRNEQERMKMALNTLTWAFYRMLAAESANGVMLIDRDDHQHEHLRQLFQRGISVQSHSSQVRDRIHLFGMTTNNASHLSSAVDVALGGFRFCVNSAHLEEEHGAHLTARSIFEPLSSLLWGVQEGSIRRIGGYGFHARPIEIRVDSYNARYRTLRDRLQQYSRSEASEDAASDAH